MTSGRLASSIGMRRVDAVRLIVAGDAQVAVAHGVRHRLPVETVVPVRIVPALARAGVPVVVERRDEVAASDAGEGSDR